jgi:hypothetical protein
MELGLPQLLARPERTGREPYAGPFLSAQAAMEACDKHFASGHEFVTLREGRVWTTKQYFSLEPAKKSSSSSVARPDA